MFPGFLLCFLCASYRFFFFFFPTFSSLFRFLGFKFFRLFRFLSFKFSAFLLIFSGFLFF